MAWECREIELWVQYMGNGSRPANSDTCFARHNLTTPYYFKHQLRPPFEGSPHRGGEGLRSIGYKIIHAGCTTMGNAHGVPSANSSTTAPSAQAGTQQSTARKGPGQTSQRVPMPVPSSPNCPELQHNTIASSPITFSTLARILKGYPRPVERELLFRGFSEGFRIPYAGPVAGPFTQPLLPNFIVSPLGIVPKKEQGKDRMIHHLSYPKGSSVNDYLEKGTCSVCYASFDEAIDLVRAAGKGALMAKADIESTFRLLPVHPSSFHLLGMQWAGQYFYDKSMPMGCAVSCSLFETFACFLEWALIESNPPGSSLHYLDDFLFIGRAGSGNCRATLNAFEHLSQSLGVPLAPGKTQGPTECLTFLGIEID
ncbi:hypothetical protein NDU88_003432 [Pleurodeles waltl]|uniref:ribonuclease H n=1 Tax=Pleurodeles waltl TaxID=8319 RepID=A0AAV7TPQ7_PLEWA|nr:hypothetical protein NDU88_003432 [Pleurodeles waltl]